MMTTTYAGYSYGLDGYILKVTAEDTAGTPGLTLAGLPDDDTHRQVEDTVELVMHSLGVPLKTRSPGTIVRYEAINAGDPRPGNLHRSAIRALRSATTLAVMAQRWKALERRTGGRPLGAGDLAETVIAADILPRIGEGWKSTLVSTRGIPGIAHAASQAGLRILTADRDGPAADNAHPFPRSVSAQTLKNAVAILTGDRRPERPPGREGQEARETMDRDEKRSREQDITPGQLRILEVAVAGRHNLCITTPGHSVATSRYAAIAADLTPELGWTESAETTRIHAASPYMLPPHTRRVRYAPMRAPHFTTSMGGMTGSTHAPGELALCHHGMLYLDDPAEIPVEIVNAIRAAAAHGAVFHADDRNDGRITRHPSRFALIVADPVTDTGPRPPGHQALIECCEIRMVASTRATGQRTTLTEAARRVREAREKLHRGSGDRWRPDRTEALPAAEAVAQTIAALDGADAVSTKHRQEARTMIRTVR